MQTNDAAVFKPLLPTPFVLAWKELYQLLISPAFYGITLFFLLFTSIFTFALPPVSFGSFTIGGFFIRNSASLRQYFSIFPLAFAFVIPALTMKSWAEERKMGTYEWLLTMPYSEWGLVLGKFLACLASILIMLILSLGVTFSVLPLGIFDGGVIFSQYLGSLLLAAGAIALGLFMSSLSKNQAAAFLLSAAILLVMGFINQLSSALPNMPRAFVSIFNFFSISYHFDSFAKGLLDTRDIIFYLAMCFSFLFLNEQALLYRKYR